MRNVLSTAEELRERPSRCPLDKGEAEPHPVLGVAAACARILRMDAVELSGLTSINKGGARSSHLREITFIIDSGGGSNPNRLLHRRGPTAPPRTAATRHTPLKSFQAMNNVFTLSSTSS